MAAPAAAAIDALGVAHVQRLQGLLQSIVAGGHGDKVDMIGHQTVGEDSHGVLIAIGLQPFEIGTAVLVGKEHVLAAIPPLRDMMRDVGEDSAGESGHVETLAERLKKPLFTAPRRVMCWTHLICISRNSETV